MIKLEQECQMCKKKVEVVVPEEAFQRWQQGELIQNCFPQLTVSEREILISQTCDECFNKLFEEE